MKRALLLILVGLSLVAFAATRAAAELLPSFQPTPTPDQVTLEQYAPYSGPGAAEQESVPVATGRWPTRPPAGQAAAPVSTPAPPARLAANPGYSQRELDEKTGPFLGRPAGQRPTLTPLPTEEIPAVPARLVIPAIDLDAPVALAASQRVLVGEREYDQWTSPNLYAAGWHTNSAFLGQPGNTVINGHNNIHGAVFAALQYLKPGDAIQAVAEDGRVFNYLVSQVLILPEAGASIEQRLENARWLSPSEDERLTLVTCWPDNGNSHRLFVVAVPDSSQP